MLIVQGESSANFPGQDFRVPERLEAKYGALRPLPAREFETLILHSYHTVLEAPFFTDAEASRERRTLWLALSDGQLLGNANDPPFGGEGSYPRPRIASEAT